MPAHPAQSVVRHRHWSITHRSTIRIAVPDTFTHSEGLWPLLCHASQLLETLFCKGSTRCPLAKSVSTVSQHLLLRFVHHRAATTAVSSELINLRVWPPAMKEAIHCGRSNHTRNQAGFCCGGKGAHRMRLEIVMPFLARSSATSLDIPAHLSGMSSGLSLLTTSRCSPFKTKSLADCSAVAVVPPSFVLFDVQFLLCDSGKTFRDF